MIRRHVVQPDRYYDSVRLMAVSGQLEALPGVHRAAAMMGTAANRDLLRDAGLLDAEAAAALQPSDLVIAVQADDDRAAEAALATAERLLTAGERAAGPVEAAPRTIEAARERFPEANLALISVPGPYAHYEAKQALRQGLHVLLFSDNVPVEVEVSLKQLARARGLLLMGPDCGTAYLGGIGLGFANVVRRGPIGVVAASGTGLQAIASLVHNAGLGLSHGIGVGGRDLSDAVGGLATFMALDALAADPSTAVIVIVSKPPGARTAAALYEHLPRLGKPVVTCLLGADPAGARAAGAYPAATLEEAAALAVRLARAPAAKEPAPRAVEGLPADASVLAPDRATGARPAQVAFAPGQRWVRGLFSGGTLASEAVLVLQSVLGPVYSNVEADSARALPDPRQSREHTVVDLGADEFTRGRPHPMIDPRERLARLQREAADPSVAVLLLDVVLGRGAHPDPAGALAPTLREVQARARAAGRVLPVVAWVCGTEDDPQRLSDQQAKLAAAGVLFCASNAAAARTAAALAQQATTSRAGAQT